MYFFNSKSKIHLPKDWTIENDVLLFEFLLSGKKLFTAKSTLKTS